ncbi:MAG: hypothetical protein AAGA54_04225 [Myxococcota bacterium]
MQPSTLDATSAQPDDLLFSPAQRMVEERNPDSGLFTVAQLQQAERAASHRPSDDDAGSGLVNVAELLKPPVVDVDVPEPAVVAAPAPVDLNAPDPSSPNHLPDPDPDTTRRAWLSPGVLVLAVGLLVAAAAAIS